MKRLWKKICLAAALLEGSCLYTGCNTIKPATFGPRVSGITETRQENTQIGNGLATIRQEDKLTRAEIAHLKTAATRSEGKASVVLQWLDRQERLRAEKAP